MSVGARTWPEGLIALYSSFLVGLPASIYFVVIPYVMGYFGISHATATFGPLPSMLLFLIGLIAGPRLSTWLGNKRLVLIAASLFSLAAPIGAFAPDYAVLVVALAVQGLAGGFILSHGIHVFATLARPDRRRNAGSALLLLLSGRYRGAIDGRLGGRRDELELGLSHPHAPRIGTHRLLRDPQAQARAG